MKGGGGSRRGLVGGRQGACARVLLSLAASARGCLFLIASVALQRISSGVKRPASSFLIHCSSLHSLPATSSAPSPTFAPPCASPSACLSIVSARITFRAGPAHSTTDWAQSKLGGNLRHECCLSRNVAVHHASTTQAYDLVTLCGRVRDRLLPEPAHQHGPASLARQEHCRPAPHPGAAGS